MKLLKMPRWPAMLSASPSGPCEMDAPGVSSVSVMKLRPLLGTPSTTSSRTRCELVTSAVSSVGSSSLTTVMVSVVTILSATAKSSISPTRSLAPSMRSVLKASVAAFTVRS